MVDRLVTPTKIVDWHLDICGLKNKIINNGKTFLTKDNCLARTNSAMIGNNSGISDIYQIRWKIDKLGMSGFNGFGICTDDCKDDCKEAQSCMNTFFYIGWATGGSECNKKHAPNGLICGLGKKESNIFYKKCIFIGEKLPCINDCSVVVTKHVLSYII